MLDIDVDHKLGLDLQRDIIGRRVAVLGVSGQGKTNTVAVFVEELLGQRLPMTIVDPEGEYWGLKEKYQILVAGSGEHADYPAGPAQAGALAQLSINESLPVILDLSEFSQAEANDFLIEYFTALWVAAGVKKTPYEVIIEEAHEFIPEGTRTPLKELLTRIALRGRKRGLGAIVISQRSQKVAKDFLTQAEMYLLHRVSHPIDLRIYKELVPLDARQVEEKVGHLVPGHVLFVYNHQVEELTIRLRHTFHAGATPTLDAQVASRLQTIDKTLLAKLAEMAKAVGGLAATQSDKEYQQARKLKELEAENEKLRVENEELRGQVATLKDLKVSLEGGVPHQQVALPDTTMKLDRMEVGQLVTAKGIANGLNGHLLQPPPSPTLPTVSSTSKTATANRPTSTPPAPLSPPPSVVLGQADVFNEFERNRFANTMRRIQALTQKEKVILKFLLERDGYYTTRILIGQAVGFDITHFNAKFGGLYRLTFFQDTRLQGVRTNVANWAKESFPRVRPDVVMREVTKAISLD